MSTNCNQSQKRFVSSQDSSSALVRPHAARQMTPSTWRVSKKKNNPDLLAHHSPSLWPSRATREKHPGAEKNPPSRPRPRQPSWRWWWTKTTGSRAGTRSARRSPGCPAKRATGMAARFFFWRLGGCWWVGSLPAGKTSPALVAAYVISAPARSSWRSSELYSLSESE